MDVRRVNVRRKALPTERGSTALHDLVDHLILEILLSNGRGFAFLRTLWGASGQVWAELHPEKTRGIEFRQVCRGEPET
jgi:hypothetical protein